MSDLVINRDRFRLSTSQFMAQPAGQKEAIVMHFTAGGSAASAFATWTASKSRVATPYIIETDGTIYELFNPEHWAYHLGTLDARHEKRTIGIELVNVGPLKMDPNDPNQLNWWPNGFGVKYCTRAETTRYEYAPFRGAYFYATFPDAQMKAAAALVAMLCERYKIPRLLPEITKRTQCDLKYFGSFRGITAHQNFRADKFDIGPAFDWTMLEEPRPPGAGPLPNSPRASDPSPSGP